MKKKIFAFVLCVAMLAIAIVGGTMAYFTDDQAQTNTFTAGQLKIKLDEAVVETVPSADGDLVATQERTEGNQKYKLFPGMTVDKDPTITLLDGSEDAYIGAIVTVTAKEVDELNLHDLAGVPGDDSLNIHTLLSGGLLAADSGTNAIWNDLSVYETDKCYIHQNADKANNTWTFYIFMKKVFKAGDSVALFEKLNVSEAYDNEEMAVLNTLSIKISAFGTQTVGFSDCYDAMTSAFDAAGQFKFS